MTGLTINISWEWALGIFIAISGALITIAWKASGRFTALETSVEWIINILKDIKVNSDNNASGIPAFASHSPLNLTPIGESWLEESGLKNYINSNPDQFLGVCNAKKGENPYEVQKNALKILDEVQFELSFDDQLKKFVFEKGTTMGVMRRVGGIYLRNLCLGNLGWKQEDIDKHDPRSS